MLEYYAIKTLAEISHDRDHRAETAELEIMLTEFETTHSLERLSAVTELTPDLYRIFRYAPNNQSPEEITLAKSKLSPEDLEKYEIRAAARNDIVPIVDLLNILHRETDFPDSEYIRLKAAQQKLIRAIGRIVGDDKQSEVKHD